MTASPNGSLAEVEIINDALDQSAHLIREREQERNYFSEQLDVRLRSREAGLKRAVDPQQRILVELMGVEPTTS